MKVDRDRIAAAILAGGRASRYGGANKAALAAGAGRTILEHIAGELARAGVGEVIVCASGAVAEAARGGRLTAVEDKRPGLGPLAGVEAALSHFAGQSGADGPRLDATVLLACDMPGITSAVIDRLIEAFVASDARIVMAETPDFSWQPLCSVVHNGILMDVRSALNAEELGVGRLWRKLGAEAVRFDDDRPFFNVNRPEDLARWRELSGEGER